MERRQSMYLGAIIIYLKILRVLEVDNLDLEKILDCRTIHSYSDSFGENVMSLHVSA